MRPISGTRPLFGQSRSVHLLSLRLFRPPVDDHLHQPVSRRLPLIVHPNSNTTAGAADAASDCHNESASGALSRCTSVAVTVRASQTQSCLPAFSVLVRVSLLLLHLRASRHRCLLHSIEHDARPTSAFFSPLSFALNHCPP